MSGFGGGDSFDNLNGQGLYSSLSVGTSAVEVKVGGSALSHRKLIIMQPKDSGIFWGYDNSVTTSNGVEMFKDQIIPLEIGPDIAVWVIGSGAGKSMRIQELA